LEALQEIRIKYSWQSIDYGNEAIEKARTSNKKYDPTLLSNDDTIKQLLARSRYFLYKNKSK
jgi:transposase